MMLPAIAPTKGETGLWVTIRNNLGQYLGSGFVYPDEQSLVIDGQSYRTTVPITWEWPS